MEQGDNFSDNLEENMRIENEFLKIKLKAQYGEAFQMENNLDVPPEIENQFLKSMMAFEEEYANTAYTTVYERIGKPYFRNVAEMGEVELSTALKELNRLLEKNDIGLDICDGPYPDEQLYRFITEELFAVKVEAKPIAGMTYNFMFEEFYPNHKADILKRTHTFFRNWFNKKFTEYCTELSWHCISSEGTQLTREDIVARLNIFFEAFQQFRNDAYSVDDTSFELLDEKKGGMGFSEGRLKYDAVMENGEVIHYEGPYKLYMQMEDNWWSIFYFVMPGYKW